MTEEEIKSKTFMKRAAFALFAGFAVSLGIFFEAIPVEFIVSIFQQSK
jgi:hypothetical protein